MQERIGRTRAEKALRELRNAVAAAGTPAAAAASAEALEALPPAQGMLQPSAVDGTRAVFIGRVRSCYWCARRWARPR